MASRIRRHVCDAWPTPLTIMMPLQATVERLATGLVDPLPVNRYRATAEFLADVVLDPAADADEWLDADPQTITSLARSLVKVYTDG